MKICVYTLESSGAIPADVIDGGYLPKSNDQESPQDWDFIGYFADDTDRTSFTSLNELQTHAREILRDPLIDLRGNTLTANQYAEIMWNRR